MSKNRQGLALLVSVAIVIGGTFLLVAMREHTVDVVGDTTESIATTTSTPSSSSVYVPPQINSELEAQEWSLVHSKKYGYAYYAPIDTYPNYFHLETFTGDVEGKSLDVFVREIFELNQSDDNPNIEDESVTEPKMVDINGTPAYEMIMTGVFDASDRGFLVDLPSRFLFMDSPSGVKIMVYYPVDTRPNNIYERILKTFQISETLIPPKEEPSAWKEIAKDSYKISYPSNLLRVVEDSDRVGIYLTSVLDGVYGHVSAGVEDHGFDPDNIQGMYGKIDNAKKITIKGRDWYQYGWGDAGCGSYIYETGLAENQTLQVSFGSCPEEDAHPIFEDEPLQQKILETITFN